ncbi:MAG: hypothetical protein FWF29_06340 [Treponema sp.]|nr:hypothetical protein [Treponema sp.]
MALSKCPGADHLRDQAITEKKCPQCGREVELFSIDSQVQCECGFTIYNDTQSCAQWCAYAKYCLGDELYNKLQKPENKTNNK